MSNNPESGVFDVAAWLNAIHLTGEARNQAQRGFNAGWEWAASNNLGVSTESEEAAYSAGEGHFTNGFDAGKLAYESDEYPNGLANY